MNTANWVCKKRDGKTVPFDGSKIDKALYRCLNAIRFAGDADQVVREVTAGVLNMLSGNHNGRTVETDVESVQRFVIQQLWSLGYFDAAEHYQNYRESHRKARLSQPVSAEVKSRFDEMRKHFPTDLQIFQFMSKFSRWREMERRRETWREATHDRVIPWLLKQAPAGTLTPAECDELYAAMYNLESLPAMRVVQMAGPALDRCHVGAFNCAYCPVADLKTFAESLYILMQGTGLGFSVESDYVSQLPRIKKQRGEKIETWVVPDTTEGWCDAIDALVHALFDGRDLFLDTSGLRKKGSRLKTKGGRASGPEPLLELAAFIRNVVKSRQGKYLEDTDVHRIMCFIGRIVQVGGVRRAAMLSLSDLDSAGMRNIKSGAWWGAGSGLWTDGRYLSMANNSAAYDDDDIPIELFMEEWLALVKSKAGERGVFNRRAAQKWKPARRKLARFGINPCAEIILRAYGFCNLSIAVARPNDTEAALARKVRVAAYFGKLQSLCTNYGYIRSEWKTNAEEERLLGVDITGHADCPLLRFDTPDRAALLRRLAKVVEEVDIDLSARFGINRSAASTTVKPSGDSAVFLDCASGVSPRFAKFQIRWVRESADSPVARLLKDSGVRWAPAPESPELCVFAFPKRAPENCTLRDDMTAEQQFHNWLEWKQNWAEHSVSATIYVEPHEWFSLGALVYKYRDHITGLSFLPKDNGSYTFAPNEEVTEAEYNKMVAEFPVINWAKLCEYETEDETASRQTMACVGGGCAD